MIETAEIIQIKIPPPQPEPQKRGHLRVLPKVIPGELCGFDPHYQIILVKGEFIFQYKGQTTHKFASASELPMSLWQIENLLK